MKKKCQRIQLFVSLSTNKRQFLLYLTLTLWTIDLLFYPEILIFVDNEVLYIPVRVL